MFFLLIQPTTNVFVPNLFYFALKSTPIIVVTGLGFGKYWVQMGVSGSCIHVPREVSPVLTVKLPNFYNMGLPWLME
ncbi:MAG: hypothetical protein K2Q22_10745, partial [Cytophagales bacterium]|nr:hypothetical protein [Cytophagales bacterium]